MRSAALMLALALVACSQVASDDSSTLAAASETEMQKAEADDLPAPYEVSPEMMSEFLEALKADAEIMQNIKCYDCYPDAQPSQTDEDAK